MTRFLLMFVVLFLSFMLIGCEPAGPSTGQIEKAAFDYCRKNTWNCGDAQMVEVIQIGESYKIGDNGVNLWPVRLDILIKNRGWKAYECGIFKNQFGEWTVWFFAER